MGRARRSADATLRDYKARLLRVMVYIQAHLDEALGLERLAAVACFSPCFEVYLNAPDSTDPEDLLTDIYAPLRPVRAGA